MLLFAFILLAYFCCDGISSAGAGAIGICEREMASASIAENVPLGVLYAVGLTETGRRGELQPYALNVEGRTIFTSSLKQALATFAKERNNGKVLIDVGCMQINHHYHGKKFASVAAMFDPAINVRYAARFLRSLKDREGSWSMAVARYHAGPKNNPAQKRYICAVIRHLVVSGFGNWTPSARAFCK